MENTEDKVFDLIENHLGKRPEKAGQKIVDDLGGDSLDLVEIIMAVEDDFDIAIADEDYDLEITVQQIIDLIAAKGAGE